MLCYRVKGRISTCGRQGISVSVKELWTAGHIRFGQGAGREQGVGGLNSIYCRLSEKGRRPCEVIDSVLVQGKRAERVCSYWGSRDWVENIARQRGTEEVVLRDRRRGAGLGREESRLTCEESLL